MIFDFKGKLLFSILGLSLALSNFSLQALERDENIRENNRQVNYSFFKRLSSFFISSNQDHNEENKGKKRKRKDMEELPLEKTYSNHDFLDEFLLNVFSLLNQRDIPAVCRTYKKWQGLMNDNQLWHGYARRAFIIKENYSSYKDYKKLIKENCRLCFTYIGNLNQGKYSIPHGVNFDGSVIVGTASNGSVNHDERAFRWTVEQGMESLGTLGKRASAARSVNLDGSVIVGYIGTYNQQRAFRWTPERGIESLGGLYEEKFSAAYGVSGDGSVIVGSASGSAVHEEEQAFRWTVEKGMEFLGTLESQRFSTACSVNFDGSVITGIAYGRAPIKAFRWTIEKGMETLGTLNGGDYSVANGISYDGLVIVGTASDGAARGGQHKAFRWTPEKGMEDVGKLLAEGRYLPHNWLLTSVTAISPSGVVLVG